MNVETALARIKEPGSLEPYIQAYRAQTGRPSIFNEITAAEILERLAAGETLRAICRDDSMPSYPTVYEWVNGSPTFANAVALARKIQATALAEEAVQILDDCDDGTMPQVQKADKRAQLRMQLAKCFDRDQFGDKVQQDVNLRGVVIHTENTALGRLMSED